MFQPVHRPGWNIRQLWRLALKSVSAAKEIKNPIDESVYKGEPGVDLVQLPGPTGRFARPDGK